METEREVAGMEMELEQARGQLRQQQQMRMQQQQGGVSFNDSIVARGRSSTMEGGMNDGFARGQCSFSIPASSMNHRQNFNSFNNNSSKKNTNMSSTRNIFRGQQGNGLSRSFTGYSNTSKSDTASFGMISNGQRGGGMNEHMASLRRSWHPSSNDDNVSSYDYSFGNVDSKSANINRVDYLSSLRSSWHPSSTNSYAGSSINTNNNVGLSSSFTAMDNTFVDGTFDRNLSNSTHSVRAPPNSHSFRPIRGTHSAVDLTSLPQVNNTKAPVSSDHAKRRRLNSNGMLLDMLSDCINPAAENKPSVNLKSDEEGYTNVVYSIDNIASPNPLLRTKNSSDSDEFTELTPINQSKGCGEGDSPMGSTPIMFAEFFLSKMSDGDGLEGIVTVPPPPLYQETGSNDSRLSRCGGNTNTGEPLTQGGRSSASAPSSFKLNEVECDPLPKMPASLTQSNLRGYQMQKYQAQESPSPLQLPKKKDAPAQTKKPAKKKPAKKSSSSSSSEEDAPIVRSTANHMITPSSAIISALSAEVRSQVQSTKESSVSAIPDFASAMEASQQSQQDIHDWDRKFGLRRAHSKTMRDSTRSRKKVLEFLKGEGLELFRKSALSSSVTTASTVGSSFTSTASNALLYQNDDMDDIDNQRDVFIKSEEVPVRDDLMVDDGAEDNSIGSFSHSSEKEDLDESHRKHTTISTIEEEKSGGSNSSSSEDLKFEQDELTQMFRRASLDHCAKTASTSSPVETAVTTSSSPNDEDRMQCFARSA